jgi:multiple sugar transport system substrate-binding protein
MASTGNFPAIMTDEALKTITSLDGFPKDKESIDALEVSNLYLETPYAENVSEISSVLNTYHSMIMGGEISVDDGIEEMNKEVAPFISK